MEGRTNIWKIESVSQLIGISMAGAVCASAVYRLGFFSFLELPTSFVTLEFSDYVGDIFSWIMWLSVFVIAVGYVVAVNMGHLRSKPDDEFSDLRDAPRDFKFVFAFRVVLTVVSFGYASGCVLLKRMDSAWFLIALLTSVLMAVAVILENALKLKHRTPKWQVAMIVVAIVSLAYLIFYAGFFSARARSEGPNQVITLEGGVINARVLASYSSGVLASKEGVTLFISADTIKYIEFGKPGPRAAVQAEPFKK